MVAWREMRLGGEAWDGGWGRAVRKAGSSSKRVRMAVWDFMMLGGTLLWLFR